MRLELLSQRLYLHLKIKLLFLKPLLNLPTLSLKSRNLHLFLRNRLVQRIQNMRISSRIHHARLLDLLFQFPDLVLLSLVLLHQRFSLLDFLLRTLFPIIDVVKLGFEVEDLGLELGDYGVFFRLRDGVRGVGVLARFGGGGGAVLGGVL